jgi:hypothetical protein
LVPAINGHDAGILVRFPVSVEYGKTLQKPLQWIWFSHTSMTAANDLAVRRALELAGVEFIDENGGGPGVRLSKRQRAKPAK